LNYKQLKSVRNKEIVLSGLLLINKQLIDIVIRLLNIDMYKWNRK